jgi:hypothetical protein
MGSDLNYQRRPNGTLSAPNPGFGHALLFDEYYQPKRAYAALQEEMMAMMTPVHWQRYYFGAEYTEPEAALDADAENDGLRTLAEIALDLDPSRSDRAAYPAMVSTGIVLEVHSTLRAKRFHRCRP